jgi:hypothetical protein
VSSVAIQAEAPGQEINKKAGDGFGASGTRVGT